MEYKLDNTIKALKDIELMATNLDALWAARTTKVYTDPLLNEFTSRGVLSAIRSVERKLDRLLLPNQSWEILSPFFSRQKVLKAEVSNQM
nr:unnamed protein product [Callosobruchus analis]